MNALHQLVHYPDNVNKLLFLLYVVVFNNYFIHLKDRSKSVQ